MVMKKLSFIALFAACALMPQATSQEVIQVEIDGVPASYDGTPPQILKGRVLVPVRGVLEQLGATVKWDDVNRVVSATREGNSFTLKIGDPVVTKNQETIRLDVPPQVITGRTMVPLRFVSEALGCTVEWNAIAKVAKITT
jgi:hypothetical protein